MKKCGQTYPMLTSVEYSSLSEAKVDEFSDGCCESQRAPQHPLVLSIGTISILLYRHGKKNVSEVDSGFKRIF